MGIILFSVTSFLWLFRKAETVTVVEWRSPELYWLEFPMEPPREHEAFPLVRPSRIIGGLQNSLLIADSGAQRVLWGEMRQLRSSGFVEALGSIIDQYNIS